MKDYALIVVVMVVLLVVIVLVASLLVYVKKMVSLWEFYSMVLQVG